MKPLVGLHGALGINVDATMWHDYLGRYNTESLFMGHKSQHIA